MYHECPFANKGGDPQGQADYEEAVDAGEEGEGDDLGAVLLPLGAPSVRPVGQGVDEVGVVREEPVEGLFEGAQLPTGGAVGAGEDVADDEVLRPIRLALGGLSEGWG